MSLSNALKDEHLEDVYHDVARTIFVALFTGDPLADGSGPEVTGGGYARQRVYSDGATAPFWTPVDDAPETGRREVTNNADFEFPEFAGLGAAIEVTHWATFDAVTAGTMLDFEAFTTAQTFSNGSVPRIKAGALRVQRK